MKTLKFLRLPALLSIFLIMISAVSVNNKETERIRKAIDVLRDFGKMKEGIPHDLIKQYQGVVVIPGMINAGIAVGGKRGKGIATVKMENGQWSNPVFITLTGGSVGAQIGVQSVDLILVFKNNGVLTKVENGDFTIGGDISATAGPVGRSSTASTDHKFEAEIYSYSKSRGLFAGISINGTNLSIDKSANAAFYGSHTDSRQLFKTSKSNSSAVKALKETLASL